MVLNPPLNGVKEKKPTSLRDLGTSYRQAFVTFIDVLGFRQIVSDKKPEEINIILDKMGFFSNQPQLRHDPYDQTKHLPMVLQFSDSIIRVQPVDENDQNISILDFFHEEITTLLLAQGNLVCNGVLVRGGLTYGKVCVYKDRIFGPAFNNAYFIESSLARYPRIVIEECLCSYGNSNPVLKNVSYHDWCSVSSQIYDYLERADDGQWAINYLPHLYEAHRTSNIKNSEVLTAHRDQLTKLLRAAKVNGRPEVLAKIRWVVSYHNRIIKNNFRRLLEEYEHMDNSLLVSLD